MDEQDFFYNLEPYEIWQLQKYGDILPTANGIYETEDESERRFKDWEAVTEIENENKTYLK